MARVKLRCPECGAVQEGQAGGTVECASCGFRAEMPAPAPPSATPQQTSVGTGPPGQETILWPCPRCGSRDVEALNRPTKAHNRWAWLIMPLWWPLVRKRAQKGTIQMATRCKACGTEWSTVVSKPT